MTKPTITDQVYALLQQANEALDTTYLTVDEICLGVYKRIHPRGQNTVRVILHRLAARGLLETLPRRYHLVTAAKRTSS